MTNNVPETPLAAPSPQAPEPTSASPEASPAPPKVDPETLVLRGSPGRVVRFRRGAIIAIAALGSTAIVGVAWIALNPATLRMVAGNEDRMEIGPNAPPEALATAPKSYGDVPMLGPPLPGDLGRPILEHQRSVGTVDPATDPATRAEQEAQAERHRIVAERMAARQSGIMMQISGSNHAGTTAPAASATDLSAAKAHGGADSRSLLDLNGRPGKADFVATMDSAREIGPDTLGSAASPWTLSAGSVIAASLITGLNSDLPGLVTAHVTENVFDSVTGRTLLIPQASRLIGSYDSVTAFGQKRALVVWQRIILPDGASMRLDNVPATDAAGFAGLADKVDFHTWQLLKGVALSTLLGIGTELSIGGEGDLVGAIRQATQQSAARAGDQIVSKNLDVQPTITVRPGWPLRVVVHKDLVLRPWRMAER